MSNKEKLIYKGFITVGIALIVYYLILKILFGFIAFSSMFCLLGVILLVYGIIEIKFEINIWKRTPIVLRRIVTVIFAIGMIIFVIIEGIIIYNGHHYDKEKPDYLVVLGAGLRGSEISTSLLYRLETALEFHEEYPEIKIVVSGGQGEGEDVTEASAMKNFLISHGVDENLIIAEDKSTNTYENFLFTKELLEKQTGKDKFKITVISNNFHMYRAKFLANEVGFDTLGYPAPAHKSSTLVFHVREFFGVIKAYIFKK